jgi:hypothetical protein
MPMLQPIGFTLPDGEMITLCNPVQPENDSTPMLTASGIVTLVRAAQP